MRGMGKREHQSGFGTLAIVLVLAVVAVLAVSGVVVYQRHKGASATNSAAVSSSQSTGKSTSTTGTQPAQTTTQYLTIKEWGVKLPLSDDNIKSAYYVVSTSLGKDPDGLPSGVWLGLNSLSDASCNPANNNLGNGTGAVGDILRVPQDATDPVSGKSYSQKYPNGVTIGGYYYGYQSWINDNSCTQKSASQAADTAFAIAAKGIVTATAN